MKTKLQNTLLFFVSLFFVGCATYQTKVDGAREKLQKGEIESALTELKTLSEVQDGDQLIYLLDYATALQFAGRYDESAKIFIQADKLSDQLEYISASRVVGATLASEEMIQYKGDTFEKTFINAFLALNFLQKDQLDSALVEARRINEKYVKLRGEDKKSYELNPFAKYLSALIWEADKKYDDAYIAFAEAYKVDPSIYNIQEDLVRSAYKSQREFDLKKWQTAFPEIKIKPEWKNRKHSELIVLFLQGWGPRKRPSPESPRFPALYPVRSIVSSAEVTVKGGPSTQSKAIYNVEHAAQMTLKDDSFALAARRVSAMVAKEVVADQIRQKNELLGAVASLAMHISDRADLRQWSTLPETIQIARLTLPAEKKTLKVKIQELTSSGGSYGEPYEVEVESRPGKTRFLILRSLR